MKGRAESLGVDSGTLAASMERGTMSGLVRVGSSGRLRAPGWRRSTGSRHRRWRSGWKSWRNDWMRWRRRDAAPRKTAVGAAWGAGA